MKSIWASLNPLVLLQPLPPYPPEGADVITFSPRLNAHLLHAPSRTLILQR